MRRTELVLRYSTDFACGFTRLHVASATVDNQIDPRKQNCTTNPSGQTYPPYASQKIPSPNQSFRSPPWSPQVPSCGLNFYIGQTHNSTWIQMRLPLACAKTHPQVNELAKSEGEAIRFPRRVLGMPHRATKGIVAASAKSRTLKARSATHI